MKMLRRFDEPILVTRPYLPPLEEFQRGCAEIWRNQYLTNNGPMVRKFHAELARYLDVPETNLALFNNGTLALELGFKALGLFGAEVITTPFTFVATAHALRRIGARPVFADVDPETLCLSPAAAEKLIKPGITKAIVPVHVYGHVCDVAGFERLAEKYGVKIIYDAAHAFGITREKVGGESRWTMDGLSIASCGDMSMFSFHPTKLFHSCEGGCLVFRDEPNIHCPPSFSTSTSLQQKLFDLRNFAIHGELLCTDVGTNAKMNELQALMGLCCLKRMPKLLAKRRAIYEAYASVFNGEVKVRGEGEQWMIDSSSNAGAARERGSDVLDASDENRSVHCPPPTSTSSLRLLPYSANHAYIPVLFDSYETRERVYAELKEKCNVFSRRYFYPLLTDFAPYEYAKGTCPIAEDAARRVLTLPTYYDLALEDAKDIARNVMEIVAR